jgi:Zn-dependent M28 family amino/carboxypeptidase
MPENSYRDIIQLNKRTVFIYLIFIGILLIIILGWYAVAFASPPPFADPVSFDSSRAYADVQTQVAFGPRIPGTEGHEQIRKWIGSELESAGWVVEVQQTERMNHPIYNIIAKRGAGSPQIILGAHYDTRMFADHDPTPGRQAEPVPGANDGASGVAVLLELARTLPEETQPVWLVFFDAEDNGNIEGWDWILGSRAFAEEIPIEPRAVVIVDMIGDADLNIYLEKNSNIAIRTEIWSTAEALGYGDKFINEEKFSMLDDHTPFLEAGIPAVDIIDFDYPYWHTTQDTPDKVSAESLHAVGDTLYNWIVGIPTE